MCYKLSLKKKFVIKGNANIYIDKCCIYDLNKWMKSRLSFSSEFLIDYFSFIISKKKRQITKKPIYSERTKFNEQQRISFDLHLLLKLIVLINSKEQNTEKFFFETRISFFCQGFSYKSVDIHQNREQNHTFCYFLFNIFMNR